MVSQSQMSAAEDVVINIGFRVKSLKKAMQRSLQGLRNEATNIRNTMAKIKTMPNADVKQMFGGSKTKVLNTFKNELIGIKDEMLNVRTAGQRAIQPLEDQLGQAQKTIKKSTKGMKNLRGMIISAGLGVMFFGMAMKRAFDTIWKFGTKAFQEAQHSVEGTVTGFDILNGAVKYLGFTIGQALEPVAAWLAPIVLAIANWVTQNQGLTATLLIILGVLGTTFMILGQLAMGIYSTTMAWKLFKTVWLKIKALKIIGWLKNLLIKFGLWIKGLKIFTTTNAAANASMGTTLLLIAAWTAAILLLIGFIYSVSLAWDEVVEGFKLKLKELGLTFQYIVAKLNRAWENFKYSFQWLVGIMKVIWGKFIDGLVSKFKKVINEIRGWANRVIRLLNKLGANLDTIPKVNISTNYEEQAKRDLRELETDWVNTIGEIDSTIRDIEKALNDVWNAQQENATEAINNIKDGWVDLFEALKGETSDFDGNLDSDIVGGWIPTQLPSLDDAAPTLPSNTPNQTENNTTNIGEVNINAPPTESWDPQSFLEQLQDSINRERSNS